MCKMSERTTRGWLCATAIIMLATSLTILSAGISGVTNPFLKYNSMHIYVIVMCTLAFLFVVAGGIIGIIGIKRHSSKCIHIMFWFLLFTCLWTFGVASNMYGLYEVYVSRDGEVDCNTGAFQHLQDFEWVATGVADTYLCKDANCNCDTSTIDSTYPTTAVKSTLTMTGGSIKKIQDCSQWRSDFDNIGDVLAEMETWFKCDGFCTSKGYFKFTDVNDLAINSPCYSHFDKYVAGITGNIGGSLYGAAFVYFILLIILAIVAGSQSRHQTFDLK